MAEESLLPCAVDEVAEKPTGLMERVRRKSLEMVLGQDAAPDAAQMAALLAGGGEVRSRDSRGDAQLKPVLLLLLLLTLSAFFGSLLEPRLGSSMSTEREHLPLYLPLICVQPVIDWARSTGRGR